MSALALDLGFAQACDPDVGRLLSVLAAAVRPGGRILEIGTGTGVRVSGQLPVTNATTNRSFSLLDGPGADVKPSVASTEPPAAKATREATISAIRALEVTRDACRK